MKLTNNLKGFLASVVALWTVTGYGQGTIGSQLSGQSGGPAGAADQQTQATDLMGKRGSEKVDLFTGTFGYSVPIACPPARNGSEPSLALVYSSGGSSGWCGYGWNLNIGYIERNTKDGSPIAYSTATIPVPLDAFDDNKGFVLNLFGKEGKLYPSGFVAN